MCRYYNTIRRSGKNALSHFHPKVEMEHSSTQETNCFLFVMLYSFVSKTGRHSALLCPTRTVCTCDAFSFMHLYKTRTHNIIKLAWRLECGWKTRVCCAFLETIHTFLQDIQQAMQWTVLKITNFDVVLISNLRYIPYRIFYVTWLFDLATFTLQTFLFSF